MLQTVILFALVYCAAASSEHHPDEIKSLPGVNFPLNYKHYSGYLNAPDGKFLFYWFVESQRSPSTDPVLLWLNGGPGCSSMEGFLKELGPLRVSPDGKSLYDNKFAWNREANVLFLDAPAGVGFSYSHSKEYATDDDKVAHDNYVALQHFFQKFPQFQKNDFYVTGESYGGVYVPTLSLKVLKGPAKINFKGFAIGNGVLNVTKNKQSLLFFAYYHGLIGNEMWKNLEKFCCDGGLATLNSCNFNNSHGPHSKWCDYYFIQAYCDIIDSDFNIYNLYADCAALSPRYKLDRENLLSFVPPTLKSPKHRKAGECLYSKNLLHYLRQPEVRKALHIPSFVQEFTVCSDVVSDNYTKLYKSLESHIHQLLKAGKRGLIYHGDVDMACNFLGGEWFCDDLGLEVKSPLMKWRYNNQIAGFVKYYNKLTFVTVKGSGHMVPEDKPAQAFHMISRFLKNKKL